MSNFAKINPLQARTALNILAADVDAMEKQNKLILSKFPEDRMPVQFRQETQRRAEKIALVQPVIIALEEIANS